MLGVLMLMGLSDSPLLQAHVSLPLEAPGRRGTEVGGDRVDRSWLLCPLCPPDTVQLQCDVSLSRLPRVQQLWPAVW